MEFLGRINPELREVLTTAPVIQLPDDLVMARQMLIPPTENSKLVRTTERFISGGDGQEMLIKIYEPAQRDQTKLPAVLWSHGGGYVLGHPDGEDSLCENFVEAANCIVISPDYRLAPEHPYPAAIEDCYSALVWMTNSAEELNIDLSRVAIGGGSAGGGLTAALALMARDKGGPAICFQMPLYPMIDDRNITFSSNEIKDKQAIWYTSNNLAAWGMYLGEHANGEISPYAAPTREEDLSGLPPTYTCVGQLDPFRDETIDYVTRLAQAGVEVEFHLYPGCFHAFEHIVPNAEISQRAKSEYINALKRALSFKDK
ncbi:alpha/beta hydrolase [Bacillus sp. CGMCC 1.60114]|uniref:alpha/beta hydrolase n=1 Tax=unclassified Bacillus (in: firmicutes) TaxID=185979 RepID=UPI00362E647B